MILGADEDLLNCTIDQLLQQAVQAVKRLNRCLWSLGMLLWALQEKGAHRERGFSSMVTYAVSLLGLDRQKAYELIRAMRVLQTHQALSRAFQEGTLGWGKVREITRVVTADTEQAWLQWAGKHSTEEVQRQVSTSPRAFKAQVLAQKASGEMAVQEQLPLSGRTAPPDDGAPASTPPASVQAGLGSPKDAPPAGGQAEPGPLDAAGPSGLDPGTPLIDATGEEDSSAPAPGYVMLSFRLSVEEYVRYERAAQLLSARQGHRLSRNQVLNQMVEQALAQASDHSRQRYPILVRVDAATGQGWFETARGPLPATPEQVEESLQNGHIVVMTEGADPSAGAARGFELGSGQARPEESTPTGAQAPARVAGPPAMPGPPAAPPAQAVVAASPADAAGAASAAGAVLPAGSPTVRAGAPPAKATGTPANTTDAQGSLFPAASEPKKGRRRRRPVSRALMRVLTARAGARCEMCGGPGPFHGDHVRPVSQGGTNCLEDLRLHCPACHKVRHADDFRHDRPWRRARDQAVRRRRQEKARREG